ncbi:MAG: hypothetical protein KGJ59_11770 [Bacteroidota bacterium]|nr:hypothetical protein [Bacteroidota bacterium]
MKKAGFIVVVSCLLFTQGTQAQFKTTTEAQPSVLGSLFRTNTSSDWLGFFNPDNFHMQQSYSMSYTTFGGQGIALARYTNSMLYQFSKDLDARVDVSLQHSPYSSFDSRIANSLNGIFLDRAEVNYRPAKDVVLRLSFQQNPWAYDYDSPFQRYSTGFGFNQVENPFGGH